jgi:hypothetical protein
MFVTFKNEYSELELVTYWSIINLIISIPFTIYLFSLVKKNFVFKLETKLITKYLGITIIIFSLTFIISDKFLVYTENIFEFIPQLLLFIMIGVVGYLILTYLLDLRIRKLVSAIINEFMNKS